MSFHKATEVPLKVKIQSIYKRCGLPKCEVAFNKINAFNLKIIENKQSLPFVQKKVRDSRHFSFKREVPPFLHYMSTVPFEVDYKMISKMFLKDLTKEEILLIQKDKDYYIRDPELKQNIKIFSYDTLFQRLLKEENETFNPSVEETMGKRKNERRKTKAIVAKTNDNDKWFDELVAREIAKDKIKQREIKEQKQKREDVLNKIYYKSREELNNINKLMESTEKVKKHKNIFKDMAKTHTITHKDWSEINRKKIKRNLTIKKDETAATEVVLRIKKIYEEKNNSLPFITN